MAAMLVSGCGATPPPGPRVVDARPAIDAASAPTDGSPGDGPVADGPADAPLPDAGAVDAATDAAPCAVPSVATWSGTASRENDQNFPDRIHATVTWQRTSTEGCVDHYAPSGMVTYWWASPGSPCTQSIAPDHAAIAPTDGTLTVDRTTAPATYAGRVSTTWPVTYTCTSGDGSTETRAMTAGGVWFDAAGVVGAAAIDGTTHVDSDQARCGSPNGVAPCTYVWSFSSGG